MPIGPFKPPGLPVKPPPPKPTPSPVPGPPPATYNPDRARTADQRRWIAMGDFFTNQYSALPCTPDLPGGYYRKPPAATINEDTEPGGTGVVSTKTATPSIFTDAFFSTLPNYSIDALLSLKSLTGNEILQVAHRQNFYTNNAVLNSNILDIVDSINFYSPTQIIKLQKPDLSYFQNNLGSYRLSFVDSTVTINIPSTGIDQSFKMEVETFAPNFIKNDTIY
jgi:hypothetical protein